MYRLILIKYSLHIYNYMSIKYFWTVEAFNPAPKVLIITLNPEKRALKWIFSISFFISFFPEDSRGSPVHSIQKTGI